MTYMQNIMQQTLGFAKIEDVLVSHRNEIRWTSRLFTLLTIALAVMIAGCANGGERMSEKDLTREYNVACLGDTSLNFDNIVKKCDLISKSNKIENNKKEIDPKIGHITYGWQIELGAVSDPSVFYYSVEIEIDNNSYNIIFTLWPQKISGPQDFRLNKNNLEQAYSIWDKMAKDVASATDGKPVSIPSTRPLR